MTNNEALKLIEAEYATTGFVGVFSKAFEYFKESTISCEAYQRAARRGLERFEKIKDRMELTKKWQAAIDVVEQVNKERYKYLICDKEAA
ncbi:hypothetical protein D3C80_1194660 [compost metagenome]